MDTAQRWYGRTFVSVIALLVFTAFIGPQLNQSAALAVLVAGVVLLGLPHGALDPEVARKAFAGRRYSTVVFYVSYLALVLIYWLLWNRYPTTGLVFFLLIAALHFGSDWASRGNFVTRCAYGLTVVTLPLLRFPSEVMAIYAMLGAGHAAALVTVSRIIAPAAVTVAAIGAGLQFRQRQADALELVCIVAGSLFLQPLVFFTCYFSLLHSPRHLFETAQHLGMTSLKSIFRATATVVVATLVLAGIAYSRLAHLGIAPSVLRIVFIGLAALTVPHMLLDAVVEAENERRADVSNATCRTV